jgi:hypothetical protein
MSMSNHSGLTVAAQQYALAYGAHYATKDLHEALELYRALMAAHPRNQEAEFARSQIQNIVNAVVPKQELLDAQVDLALAQFERVDRSEVKSAPCTPLSSRLPHSA